MKVGVLYSSYDKYHNKEVEQDLLSFGLVSQEALHKAGYDVELVSMDDHTFEDIAHKNFDLIFNVCERLEGDGTKEPHVASALELLDINITGSPGNTIKLCNDKVKVKELAAKHDIPTPRYQVFTSSEQKWLVPLQFPVIVKPSSMHNSIGIDRQAVVNNEKEMYARIAHILKTYKQAALVEEFIEGRDVEVSLLGNGRSMTVMPLMELYYRSENSPKRFFDYDSKWNKDSPTYGDYTLLSQVSKNCQDALVRIAKKCYKLVGLRDYGRIDFRLDKKGKPYLIEINANPGISAESSMMRAASFMESTQHKIIVDIFHIAAKRCKIGKKIIIS